MSCGVIAEREIISKVLSKINQKLKLKNFFCLKFLIYLHTIYFV